MSTTLNPASSSSVASRPTAVACPVEPAQTGTSAQAAPSAAATPAAGAKDAVALSSESGEASKPNPYAGVSESSTSVSVDGWKKGKNDSVEGILRNQGYSLKDIYSKDKEGKTLIDRVAQTNSLKNPNVIHPGQTLQVPSRENSESLSSKDLKPGEEQSSKVTNKDAGVTTESTMSRDAKGNNQLDVGVENKQNPDAGLSTQTKTPADGRIDSSTRVTESDKPGQSGTETNTVAMNGNGSAVTGERTTATTEGTTVDIKDLDKKKNLGVQADSESVSVSNPGNGKSGAVTSQVDISEKSSDGAIENLGRKVNDFIFGAPEKPKAASAQGASDVQVSKDAEGRAKVSVTVNGEKKEVLATAGDTDDSLLEKVGSALDSGVSAVSDAAKSTWDTVSGWFGGGGGEEPATSKSEVGKSAS